MRRRDVSFGHLGRRSRWRLSLAAALLLAASCSRPADLVVDVKLQLFAGSVEWLDVSAFDEAADAGPTRVPSSPVAGGLGVSRTVDVRAVAGTTVVVTVDGLGADGRVLASGRSAPTAVRGGSNDIEVDLTAHCLSQRDCDPDQVCQGALVCTSGFCAAPPVGTAPPPDGTGCGPCDAGSCSAGSCRLGFCCDGIFEPQYGEQCDDDAGNSDTLPDRCRTDCTLPHCGDGVRDPDAGEVCDLGAAFNGLGWGCDATCAFTGEVTTFAGSRASGNADGTALVASFARPYGLALLDGGLYVADTLFRSIRRIDLATALVTTVAGGIPACGAGLCDTACRDVDGVGPDAGFCDVAGLLAYQGALLATDDAALRTLTPGGELGTFSGQLLSAPLPDPLVDAGPFASALLGLPQALAAVGAAVYSDTQLAGLVLESNPATDSVSVLAGLPQSNVNLGGLVAVGRSLYLSEIDDGVVTRLDLSPDGGVASGPFDVYGVRGRTPDGLCTNGRALFICGAAGNVVEELDLDSGVVSLLAGGGTLETDGVGADAGLFDPAACAYDATTGALYVSDRSGNTIRRIR